MTFDKEDLSRIPLVETLKDVLCKNSVLKTLRIRLGSDENDYESFDERKRIVSQRLGTALTQGLSQNQSLETLGIDSVGVPLLPQHLTCMLHRNTTIQHLHLSNMPGFGTALVKGLYGHPLVSLSLRSFKLSSEQAGHLVVVLSGARLEELTIADNDASWNADALEGIHTLSNLRVLDVSCVEIDPDLVEKCITPLLRHGREVKTIRLCGIQWNTDSLVQLGRALNGSTLEHLNIGSVGVRLEPLTEILETTSHCRLQRVQYEALIADGSGRVEDCEWRLCHNSEEKGIEQRKRESWHYGAMPHTTT